MSFRLRGLVIPVVLVVLVGGGCAGKKRGPTGPGTTGIAEEGLAAEGSLEQFKVGAEMPQSATGPLRDINFAFDSFELDETARTNLRENAEWLQGNSRLQVEIEGHCDERGTIEYNLALGAKRARATKDYMVALGIDSGRLTTISYGEELPLCERHTESCWQENRRAHFVLLRD